MIEFVKNNIFLVLFLPVWVCFLILINSFVKFTDTKKLTLVLTLFSTFTGLVFSVVLTGLTVFPAHEVIEQSFSWFNIDDFSLNFGVFVDNISSLFLFILFSVSFLVQLYSYEYMKNDKEFHRYYILLNFFNFSMSALILSANLIQTYVFWELVGVGSYLLVGFWYYRYNVSKSAQKVFWINRIGDTSLLLGTIILLYFVLTYPSSFAQGELLSFSNMSMLSENLKPLMYPEVYTLICLLLLLGAFVKSAQFPFQVWLVEAMKAPTPVSALIHSSTMVCAGLFLMLRLYPLFLAVPVVIKLVLYVGIITALLCSFFALTQKNIKKMLAYSTSSHLGLMFAGLGIFAPTASIIYFAVHAYTKALLFLISGIVSKKYNSELNMNKMGGLRHSNPLLALMWFVAALSLCGLCFSGFIAKEILLSPFYTQNEFLLLSIILISVCFSSIYIFKSYFKIFEGNEIKIKSLKKFNCMHFSTVVLAFLLIVSGFLINSDVLKSLTPKEFFFFEFSDFKLVCISLLTALSGIVIAYFVCKFKKSFMPLSLIKLSYRGFYLDKIFDFAGKNICINIFRLIYLFDKYIVDGVNKIFVLLTDLVSLILKKLQNGNLQSYIAYAICSVGIIIFYLLYCLNYAKELN